MPEHGGPELLNRKLRNYNPTPYDYADAEGSVIEWLRKKGQYNPWNTAMTGIVKGNAAGMRNQFLASLFGKQGNTSQLPEEFATFLDAWMSGGISPGDSKAILNQLAGAQTKFKQWSVGNPEGKSFDLNTQGGKTEAIEAYRNIPGLDLGDQAITRFLDPQDQAEMYFDAQARGLGPDASASFQKAMMPALGFLGGQGMENAISGSSTPWLSLINLLSGNQGVQPQGFSSPMAAPGGMPSPGGMQSPMGAPGLPTSQPNPIQPPQPQTFPGDVRQPSMGHGVGGPVMPLGMPMEEGGMEEDFGFGTGIGIGPPSGGGSNDFLSWLLGMLRNRQMGSPIGSGWGGR